MQMGKLSERILAALAIAALAGGSFLVASGELTASGPSASVGEGRGDNPVVGSLPCAVDEDELGLKFFKWIGGSMSGSIDFQLPTIAMVGGSDLENYIVDLNGTPDGLVNRTSGFTAVGSVQQMTLTADRSAATVQDYRVALWLPDGLLGSDVEMTSTLGTFTWTASTNAFVLPVGMLASAPGPIQSGTITVTPVGDSAAVLQVTIDVIAGMVLVDFQP
jgi:hypothetical protein